MYHMLTGQVPFTADNFMGILTKHLLEAPVPPRKRRPDLEIAPEVEAICLRAMEKDRDKRFADMDALYRALGASGDFAFEPSQVFVPPRLPKASLKYPTLAAASVDARESRTAIAVSGSGAGTFEDERPGRPDEAPAGSRKPAVIAMVVGGVALAIAGLLFALKPSGKPAAPEPAAAANPAPTQAAAIAAPPPAATPTPVPAATPKPAAAAAETPPPPSGAEPSRPGRSSRRHRSAESTEEDVKPDPLHRAIPLPAETPAEIKPFPTN